MATSEAICGVCGTASAQPQMDALEMAGPPDFDTRPGEPVRSSIGGWVQRCPECGYCAQDLSYVAAGIEAIVRHADYQNVLKAEAVPENTRAFLAYSGILESVGQTADAGWVALQAAWAADDAGDETAAGEMRRRALELWKKGKAAGQDFAGSEAEEFGLVTDVARRCGLWDEAAAAARAGLDGEDVPPLIEAMLRRQLTHIQQRDSARHDLGELGTR